ncbi:hypothetical protein TNCV_1215301 [Trichonephila clavipes]|nr:hypothetical protein TNCV_1215301 [Trichonephila clavipes]
MDSNILLDAILLYTVCPNIKPTSTSQRLIYSSSSGGGILQSSPHLIERVAHIAHMFPLIKALLKVSLRIALSAFVALVSTICLLSNRCPLSGIFNREIAKMSQRAISGLYGGWWSCAILCFDKYCCTRFDVCAGALS